MQEETILWDYVTDNNGNVKYANTYLARLHDSFENYDVLIVELIRYLQESYTMFANVPVYPLLYGRSPGRFGLGVNQGGWAGRSASFTISGTNLNKIKDTYAYNNSMGLVRVVGIKAPRQTDLLWNYVNDNAGEIYYGTEDLTLNDDINKYDELIIDYTSANGDPSDADWNCMWINTYPVEGINNAWNPNYILQNTHNDRMSAFYINNRTIRRKLNNQNGYTINGICNVWGVKYL